MVSSGLLSFALQWRTALRAFTDLGTMFGGRGRSAGDPVAAIEAPASWFVAGQIVGFAGLACLGHLTLRHALLGDGGGGRAVVRARARRVPRHRRDRHHARRRHGQDHPAHVRRAAPGRHEREPHERQHHRGRGEQRRRPPDRPQERLPAGRAIRASSSSRSSPASSSAPWSPCCPSTSSCQRRASGHGPVPGAGRPDLARVALALSARHSTLGPGEDLVHRRRRRGGHRPDPAADDLPEAAASAFRRPPASAWPGPSTGTTVCSSSWAPSRLGVAKK